MKRKLKLNSLKLETIITCIVAILVVALIALSLVVNNLHGNKENVTTPNTKHEEPLEDGVKLEEEQKEQKQEEDALKLIHLGEFKLTAYCPCSECCGKWAGGATASGVMPTVNHTIAVDTSVIPFGTKVVIDGIDNVTFVAEDTGSAIIGNKIDIYMNSHEEALEFGVQYKDVYIVKELEQ